MALARVAITARACRAPATPSTRHSSADDQHIVRVLAGLLRVGIALDRSHAGGITSVRCHRQEPNHLTIEVTVRAGHDASLELYAADQRIELLASTLGWIIELAETAG